MGVLACVDMTVIESLTGEGGGSPQSGPWVKDRADSSTGGVHDREPRLVESTTRTRAGCWAQHRTARVVRLCSTESSRHSLLLQPFTTAARSIRCCSSKGKHSRYIIINI